MRLINNTANWGRDITMNTVGRSSAVRGLNRFRSTGAKASMLGLGMGGAYLLGKSSGGRGRGGAPPVGPNGVPTGIYGV